MASTNYTWDESSDGTYTIRGVPVFELGKHRGFQYDESWAKRALRSFAKLKKDRGYLPPVILGHTADDGHEKPAVGFMDRLRLTGSHLVADLVGISRELFEQVRKGCWPYRSIEVFDKEAQITALALLGGTRPYMKTDPLHFAEDGSAGVWVSGEHLPRLEDDSSERGSEATVHGGSNAQETNGGSMQTQGKQFSQQEMDRLIENARCEERARAEEQLRETKDRLEQLEAETRMAHKRAFRSQLQQLGYTPAILDSKEMGTLVTCLTDRAEPVRFGEEEVTPLKLFGQMLRLISTHAEQKQLFVEIGERADSGKFRTFDDMGDTSQDDAIARLGEQVDPTSVERYVQARELAEAEGMAFRDALQQVTASNS
jgi:hypothetical protein